MSVDSQPRKRAALANRKARESLRKADPVLARLIDARPDFRPDEPDVAHVPAALRDATTPHP